MGEKNMNLGSSSDKAFKSGVSRSTVDGELATLRNMQGEMSGFETLLGKMCGGVFYTLLCFVNSVFTLITFMVIALVIFDAVVPDDSSPAWAPVNGFMLWASRIAASRAGMPVPGSLDDMLSLIYQPLFAAWLMVVLWLPYAVLCVVVAVIGGFLGWRGPGRFPLLGRFAVAVNLPGRIWTSFVRLLFGWAFRRKLKFFVGGIVSAGATLVIDPLPMKYYRWGNRYGSGVKSKFGGFNPLFLVAFAAYLFFFLVTVISWSMSALPYLFPIIGLMLQAQPPLPDSTVAIWGVSVAFLGLTLGVWIPASCDFYHRYGMHLTIRQRFDWFPLMPKPADLAKHDEDGPYQPAAATALGSTVTPYQPSPVSPAPMQPSSVPSSPVRPSSMPPYRSGM